MVPLWQRERFIYLLSRGVLDEYLRALSYPKFKLTDREIKALIEEDLLPFVEIVASEKTSVPRLKDRDDEKFLALAIDGRADFLVTGDRELLDLRKIKKTAIVGPSEFLKHEAISTH